jgi:hypothetical protein
MCLSVTAPFPPFPKVADSGGRLLVPLQVARHPHSASAADMVMIDGLWLPQNV